MANDANEQLKIATQLRDMMSDVSLKLNEICATSEKCFNSKSWEKVSTEMDKNKKSTQGLTSSMGELAKIVQGPLAKAGVIAHGFLEGLAQGFRNLFALTKAIGSFFGGVIGGLFDVGAAILTFPIKVMRGLFDLATKNQSTEYAQALEDIRKQWGNLEGTTAKAVISTANNMKGFSDTGLNTFQVFGNVAQRMKSVNELATAMGPLFENISKEFDAAGGHIMGYQKALGTSNEEMSGFAIKAKMTGQKLEDVQLDFAKQALGMEKAFGLSGKAITRDMGKAQADIAHFSQMVPKELGAAAAYARSMGTELTKLAGLMDKFSTFDAAAESVANLNEHFGTNIDAEKLMAEQNPAKKFEMLRKAMASTGKDMTKLNFQDKQMLIQNSAMGAQEVELMLANKARGDQYDKFGKQGDKNAKKELTQQEAMEKLSGSIEKLVIAGSKTSGIFDRIVEGFTDAIMWSRPFMELLQNLRTILMDAYLMGRKLGAMFIESFPGVKDMIDGLKELFNPANFKKMFDGVLKAFDVFGANGSGKFEDFMENINKVFFDFFNAGKPGANKIFDGLKKFGGILVDILTQVGVWAIEKLAGLMDTITDWIKNPKIPQIDINGKAILTPFEKLFDSLADTLWPALKRLGVTIWDKIVAAIQTPTGMAVAGGAVAIVLAPAIIQGVTAALGTGLSDKVGGIVGGFMGDATSGKAAQAAAKSSSGSGTVFSSVVPDEADLKKLESASKSSLDWPSVILFLGGMFGALAIIIKFLPQFIAATSGFSTSNLAGAAAIFGGIYLLMSGMDKMADAMTKISEIGVIGAGGLFVAGAVIKSLIEDALPLVIKIVTSLADTALILAAKLRPLVGWESLGIGAILGGMVLLYKEVLGMMKLLAEAGSAEWHSSWFVKGDIAIGLDVITNVIKEMIGSANSTGGLSSLIQAVDKDGNVTGTDYKKVAGLFASGGIMTSMIMLYKSVLGFMEDLAKAGSSEWNTSHFGGRIKSDISIGLGVATQVIDAMIGSAKSSSGLSGLIQTVDKDGKVTGTDYTKVAGLFASGGIMFGMIMLYKEVIKLMIEFDKLGDSMSILSSFANWGGSKIGGAMDQIELFLMGEKGNMATGFIHAATKLLQLAKGNPLKFEDGTAQSFLASILGVLTLYGGAAALLLAAGGINSWGAKLMGINQSGIEKGLEKMDEVIAKIIKTAFDPGTGLISRLNDIKGDPSELKIKADMFSSLVGSIKDMFSTFIPMIDAITKMPVPSDKDLTKNLAAFTTFFTSLIGTATPPAGITGLVSLILKSMVDLKPENLESTKAFGTVLQGISGLLGALTSPMSRLMESAEKIPPEDKERAGKIDRLIKSMNEFIKGSTESVGTLVSSITGALSKLPDGEKMKGIGAELATILGAISSMIAAIMPNLDKLQKSTDFSSSSYKSGDAKGVGAETVNQVNKGSSADVEGINALGAYIKTVFDALSTSLPLIIGGILGPVSSMLATVDESKLKYLPNIATLLTAAFGLVKSVSEAAKGPSGISITGGTFAAAINVTGAVPDVGVIMDKIKDSLPGLVGSLISVAKTVPDGLDSKIKTVGLVFSSLSEIIKVVSSAGGAIIKTPVAIPEDSQLKTWLDTTINPIIHMLNAFAGTEWGGAYSIAPIFTSLSIISGMIKSDPTATGKKLVEVFTGITGIVTSISNVFSGVGNTGGEWGGSLPGFIANHYVWPAIHLMEMLAGTNDDFPSTSMLRIVNAINNLKSDLNNVKDFKEVLGKVKTLFEGIKTLNDTITSGPQAGVDANEKGVGATGMSATIDNLNKLPAQFTKLGPAFSGITKTLNDVFGESGTAGLKTMETVNTGMSKSLIVIQEMVKNIQALDTALNSLGKIDVKADLEKLGTKLGLGGSGIYSVQGKDVNVIINLAVTMRTDDVEDAIIHSSKGIIRDRINLLIENTPTALSATTDNRGSRALPNGDHPSLLNRSGNLGEYAKYVGGK